MRETLFRGKNNKGKWVKGGIIPLDIQSGYVFIAEPFLSASTLPVYEIIKHHTHLVIPETVGQFTGLYDSTKWEELTTEEQAEFLYPDNGDKRSKADWKGKPIFEGDIIIARVKPVQQFPKSYAIGKVVFENGTFKISVYKSSNSIEYRQYTSEDIRAYPIENNFINRGYKLEVIGNIHDNPDLLCP